MEQLEQFQYQKLNYQNYQKNIKELLKKKELKDLGIQKTTLAKTKYLYDIDCITIGKGKKELFLVGGTHGSEPIGTDYLLNFINTLPTLEEFDPNHFKLIILPLQNPEGFDISSNTLRNIHFSNFQESAYEYYLRYRTDSIILKALQSLNQFMETTSEYQSTEQWINSFQTFIQTTPTWKHLSSPLVMPNITFLNEQINHLNHIKEEKELKIKLLTLLNQTIKQLKKENIHDQFLEFFLNELKIGFSKKELWTKTQNEDQKRLYQQMFESISFDGLANPKLVIEIEEMYQKYHHPKGSQIGHDATGSGVNLNANNDRNPGLTAIKENHIIYGNHVKSNIKNYHPGPLGSPTEDPYHFQFSIENQVLETLIQTSYQKNTYLATLLFHGTGGLIYYKPYQGLMKKQNYQEFYPYNQELANIYSKQTDYRLLEESSTTGYGDYLRRTYPGVLLIELSKMGGNPIGPYGDKNNIYQVFHDNNEAMNSLFHYFNKQEKTKVRKK